MRANEILFEMATLSKAHLGKRDNWAILADKIKNGEELKLGQKGDSGTVTIMPEPDLIQALVSKDFEGTPYTKGASIVLPTTSGDTVKLTDLYKDEDFGGIVGGKESSERQETGIVQAINSAVDQSGGPITLVTGDNNIKNVTGAKKVEGTNSYGKEPYADVEIAAGGKKYLISAKGSSAPSVAGGGLMGLHQLDPNILASALDAALSYYKKNHSDKIGKPIARGQIPEVYSKIDHKYLKKILQGDEKMGGPISHMYVGPMDVDAKYNNGILKVSGNLIPIEEYMDDIEDIYLRIRRRSQDQMLNIDQKDKLGYPSIFYSTGEGHRRLVVYPKNKLPNNLQPYSENMFVRKEA